MTFFLNVEKPQGMTSHDVVSRIRKITGLKYVGHAGTLDRMATGVLPIAFGQACRLLRFLPSEKIYLAEFLLGTTTDTDDIEGKILAQSDIESCSKEMVREALEGFLGEQMQRPPAYSNVHHSGKRLYKLAKAGRLPEDIPPRKITIQDIQILEINFPVIKLRIHCSGGTYIRAIARDLGDKLAVGACLQSLVRERSGPFTLEQSKTLTELGELARAGRLEEGRIDPAEVIPLSVINLDQENADRLKMGQFVILDQLEHRDKNLMGDKYCLVKWEKSLIALCTIASGNILRPEVVVANAKSLN